MQTLRAWGLAPGEDTGRPGARQAGGPAGRQQPSPNPRGKYAVKACVNVSKGMCHVPCVRWAWKSPGNRP